MKIPLFRTVARIFCVAALGASASLQAQTPVLHFSFENVGGLTVTNDGSGGSAFDGTLNGTATVVAGGVGNCLSISGANANSASCRIASSVVPLDATSPWTVAIWIRTSTAGACYAYQGDGGWADGNTSFYLNQGNGDPGTRAGGVRYAQNWVTGTSAINDGIWHHIVVSCNGSTRSVYVDGVLENSGDTDWGALGTGSQFWIGGNASNNDGAQNLNGQIDEVNVYDQALSPAQVQALYASQAFLVPVAVSASPSSDYRGTTFNLTATATPGSGTVTNVTANLSSIGLSATAPLVLSATANVFTNSFTVPATAPIGVTSLSVTVKTDTDPFIGVGRANFTVVAFPPTNVIVVTPISPASVYEYTEASFTFAATNDAPKATTNDVGFPMAYSWYTNNVLVSSNMGPKFTFLTVPSNNGMQVKAIARVADTNFSSLSVTSATVTLTVNAGSVTYTNGLKEEFFGGGATRQDVEIGNVGPGVVRRVTVADSPGGFGDNTSRRYSGYFIPPVNDSYVFFVAADDDTDVFLSTDSSPANKLLIAQETAWSGTRTWQASTASINSQKRSDQWTNSLGVSPYATGIPLVAGQKYYFESVVHNGTGGDNWAVTYQTISELTLDPTQPVDGSATRMNAASNNIAFATFPGTAISWVTQPQAAVTVYEGQSTNFISLATSDAELVPFYQWYLNNTPIGGNTATLDLNAIPASYNNAQIKVVASTISGLSITSSVSTLTVLQAVFEPGWVAEKKWMSVFNIAGAENGTLGTPTVVGARPGFMVGRNNPSSNVPGLPFNQLDSSLQQIGVFVAPETGKYAFFISSHDGGNLFLSTNNTPGGKRLIAQETGWTSGWNWNTVGGGGSTVSQKRSDQWSPDGGVTVPYSTGIPLVAGQRYYMEVAHTTSRWGNERVGVTYSLMDEFNNVLYPPVDGSLANCIGTNVGMFAIRCTYVAFTQQPAPALTCSEGSGVAFSVAGTSDSIYPLISPDGYTITQPSNTLFCQWYKILGGVTNAIPGATETKLTTGPLTLADNGAKYYCAVRALGYADNSLNRIWTNSQIGTVTVTARTPSLLGHWFGGAATLADSANYVAPGVYDGSTVGGGTYYFTNDVPPSAPSGAQSIRLQGAGIVISNTVVSDPGYVVDTFDGNIQNQFTIAFWAKGSLNSWDPWVSKNGENWGWQVRKLGWSGDFLPTFTMRGSGGDADPFPSLASESSQWHYYAGTFDTTTGSRKLYLDGKLINEQTGQTAYTLASSSKLVIGGRQNNNGAFGNYLTGNLYDLRIYNYALTQGEVVNIGGVPPPFTSEIVAGQLVITWPVGTLLQATNVLGPWTTYATVSPATINMTLPQQFFRVKNP